MNRRILIGLFLFIFDMAGGQNIVPEDYAIYSKVLNAFLKEEGIKARKIILEGESENEIAIDPQSMWDTTLAVLSYKLDSVNKNRSFFDSFSLRNYQLIVVPKDDLQRLMRDKPEGDWSLFHKTYPNSGGIVSMSKMFLAPNRTWGLIYISISRGGLKGAGYLIKFDLRDKRIIKAKERIWIS